jgi:hypothetical protein
MVKYLWAVNFRYEVDRNSKELELSGSIIPIDNCFGVYLLILESVDGFNG